MSNAFALVLACRMSGQIDDKAWQAHLLDPLFRAWVAKRQ
jgi:stalled ribosome alternative rescue factor ArfA